jgi:TRAP-type mannitol/chloroaromatic compound transport system substrate-binding protein
MSNRTVAKTIDRRKLLKHAALAGTAASAAVATGFPTPALAQGKRELKMALGFPKAFPGFGDFAVSIAKRIETVSGGKLKIKVYGAGELIKGSESIDAAGAGTVDMYYAAAYTMQHKSKALNFFTTIPFGLTMNEHWAWYTHGGGQELADDFFSKFNIKPFMCGQTYMQWGGWFNKEIKSVEDVRGLKIRISGLGGEVYRKLGATPLVMSVRESQPAMASGVVDAIEQHGPWVDQIMGYQKLAKYYYFPGWQEPNTDMMLGMNKDLWDSFSKDDQEALSWAIPSGLVSNFGRHFVTSTAQLARLKKENPQIKVLQFPDDVLLAFGKKTLEVLEELAASDPEVARIWTSYKAFLMSAMDYTAHTDLPFLNARAKVFG